MAGGVFLQIFFLAMLIMPPVKTQSKSENTPAKHEEKEYEPVSSMKELTMKLLPIATFYCYYLATSFMSQGSMPSTHSFWHCLSQKD